MARTASWHKGNEPPHPIQAHLCWATGPGAAPSRVIAFPNGTAVRPRSKAMMERDAFSNAGADPLNADEASPWESPGRPSPPG